MNDRRENRRALRIEDIEESLRGTLKSICTEGEIITRDKLDEITAVCASDLLSWIEEHPQFIRSLHEALDESEQMRAEQEQEATEQD